MRRDVFQAIADPTRREILGMIARQPLNVNTISERFEVSRAAVYKHLKILTECGLVAINQHGRERYCEARLKTLGEVNEWVEQYRQFWSIRPDSLEAYLGEPQMNKQPTHKHKKKKKNRHKKSRENLA